MTSSAKRRMRKTIIFACLLGLAVLVAVLAFRPSFTVLSQEFFPGVAVTNQVQGIGICFDQLEEYGLTASNVLVSVGAPETDRQFLYVTPNGRLDKIVVPVGGHVCFAVIEKSEEIGIGVALVKGPQRPIKATLKQ